MAGDISVIRDFIDVRDVVRAYDTLFLKGKKGEIKRKRKKTIQVSNSKTKCVFQKQTNIMAEYPCSPLRSATCPLAQHPADLSAMNYTLFYTEPH